LKRKDDQKKKNNVVLKKQGLEGFSRKAM